jgi:hypothetical protein
MKVAEILNGPWDEILVRMKEARSELKEDVDLAEAQFQARLRVGQAFGGGPYDPVIEPSEFSPIVTNPYMPLIPGQTLVYEGRTSEGLLRRELTTLAETAMIGGVECRVVRELETLNGERIEDSVNWFAQHKSGEVWYFGEIAMHYEDGILDSLEGSWKFGKDGAKPGIVMPAFPSTGNVHRQQFHLNVAEDIARIVSTSATSSVPCGKFHNCVETEDFSALEPDDLDHKVFAPGVGLVVEIDMVTGERLELVQMKN